MSAQANASAVEGVASRRDRDDARRPRKRIVVTDLRFDGVAYERAVSERFDADFEVLNCDGPAEVVAALSGTDVAFVNLVPVDAAALSGMRPGGLIVRYGVGYDNVDLEAARRAGIRLSNIPDYGSDTVADHAASMMLTLLRRLPVYTAAIRRDGWARPDMIGPIPALSSMTVGLLGIGRIGLLVAKRLQAFGTRILATDPYADVGRMGNLGIDLVPIERLLAESHGVSLHMPATAETRHIINADTLARMRPSAVLVNTARGSLIDEVALVAALKEDRLAGAGLDVFDPEPLSGDSPLRGMDNVVLTPHAGFFSTDSLEALQRMAAEEAARALADQPLKWRIV